MAILYLHVSPATKRWLKRLCKEEVGTVSQSTMAEKIFTTVQRIGLYGEKTRKSVPRRKVRTSAQAARA